jgi:hypothetical protein
MTQNETSLMRAGLVVGFLLGFLAAIGIMNMIATFTLL